MKAARLQAWGIVALAALFGAALLGTAALASRSLRERDEAVRDGILLREAHVLEALLRATTPDAAAAVLREFLKDNADTVEGVAIVGPAGVLASAGADTTGAFEVPAALGRDWRPAALGAGAEAGSGPGSGQGRGGGFLGGRGPGGRGTPSIRLRLRATPAVGNESALSRLVLAGGAGAALALVGLSLVAARGMAERQRREAAEAESQRLATVARAGAGLAHRLRNPLAVVKGTAQLLEERVPEGERERVARIVTASGRMETILSRLLDFARPPAPQPTSFDLAALARDVASRVGGTVVRAERAVQVRADREHVETILEELLANARASDPGGTIDVTARVQGTRAVLEVADRGPGLDLDPASAFEPYVTSRPDGTGLGLAIVRALAASNGGTATLAPRPGGGCVASLSLPAPEA
ncbi:MAG: HAMP domain-containing sensor histidine kinase [Thermoanaerobaculia bacterium]